MFTLGLSGDSLNVASEDIGGSMEEDYEILGYAQELFRQIQPGKPEPGTVSWDEGLPLDRVVVRYGEVKLPFRLRGKLTAEDWRPLIASSIVYNQSLYKGQRKGSFTRLVLPLAVADIPLIYALLQILQMRNGLANIELVLVVALWTLFACSVLAFYIHWLWRGLFYAADKRSAEIVGTATILESLRKSRDVISASMVSRKRFSLLPGMNQRVQKLEKL